MYIIGKQSKTGSWRLAGLILLLATAAGLFVEPAVGQAPAGDKKKDQETDALKNEINNLKKEIKVLQARNEALQKQLVVALQRAQEQADVAQRARAEAEAQAAEAQRTRRRAQVQAAAEKLMRAAEDQVARALIERQFAEKNYRKVLDTVDKILTPVIQQAALDKKENPVRQQLLEEGLQFYQGFLKEKGDDPATGRETARAHQRIGDIRMAQGKLNQAQTAYRKAIQLQEKLVAQFPAQPEYRQELGRTYTSMAALLTALGQKKESEQFSKKAKELKK